MSESSIVEFSIVEGMSLEDYLAVDALGSGDLRLIARSPWHYANRIRTASTPAMLRGTLAHCAILEPGAMAARYAVVPEGAPNRPSRRQWDAKKPSPESRAAMDWWTNFNAEIDGREIVRLLDYELCHEQIEAVSRNSFLAGLLRSGRGEVSIFWRDEKTGIKCKARPDWLPNNVAMIPLDLKTCVDESPSGFGRVAARLRYDLQDAHYTAGIEAVTGEKVAAFVFAAVTNKPPVLAVPYFLTDEIRAQGREERDELLALLAHCRREDHWPAYGDGPQLLDFPAYAKHGGEVEVEWNEENQA